MIWNFIIATENYEEDCNTLDQVLGKGRKTRWLAEYYTDQVTVKVINWTGHSTNQFRGIRADILYIPAGAFIDQELYNAILRPMASAICTTESIMERLKYYLTKK